MSEVRDSEATPGTGRLLGLFFGLVVLCAVFFAFGFTLGRSAVHAEPAPPATASVASPGLAPSGEPKPEAGVVAENSDCPNGDCSTPREEAPPSRDELTFYKAVSQKEPEARLLPPDPPPSQTPARSKPAPAAARAAVAGGYTVQVAAVTKREDAEALANALRKKNYPVFTSTNLPVDKLVHVQVGPFASIKAAEEMRSKLRSDGYNPIVKK
jgi:DedD protein